ncbi:MAG: hypothetical protein JNK82_21190 [Myxococcaceae bacterium]|nr:hypothetical protein [Myxococcaceae bacterium]
MKNSFGVAHALALGLCLGLVVSSASCSGTKPPTSKCTRTSCPTGCCDDDGSCYGANDAGVYSNEKCGFEGGVCNVCTMSQVCVMGQCKLAGTAGGAGGGSATGGGSAGAGGGSAGSTGGGTGTGNCNATNCANGCCTAQGQCNTAAQQSFSKCGAGGAMCAGCPVGQTCPANDAGTGGVCSVPNCGTCLDAQGTCRSENTMTNDNYCGSAGGLCQRCNTNNMERCMNGRCVGTSAMCNMSNCDGCCAGNTCIARDGGISNAQCGINAQACQTCNMPATCDANTGACMGGTGGGGGFPGLDGGFPLACDATSCPAGCCIFGIGCLADGEDFNLALACGTGGAACKLCAKPSCAASMAVGLCL